MLAKTITTLLVVAVALGKVTTWPDDYFPHFHVRPMQNWINDPNGPFRREGDPVIHLFMQYSPNSVFHQNDISWYHCVSTDYVKWADVGIGILGTWAMGIWSGSVTVVDTVPLAFYTCCNNSNGWQQQCYAVPANLSDPLLKDWVEAPNMPFVPFGPKGNNGNFRDPATMIYSEPLQRWMLPVGVGYGDIARVAIYSTIDFNSWNLTTFAFEAQIWMFECPDLYQVDETHWILKTSVGIPTDIWRYGSLDPITFQFTVVPTVSTGTSMYDFGITYASKSFYDPVTLRRILWAWVLEEQPGNVFGQRSWASSNTLPRHITWCAECGRVRTAPLVELQQLRNATLNATGGFHLMQKTNTTNRITHQIIAPDGGMTHRELYAQQEIVAYFTISTAPNLSWFSFGISVRVGSGNYSDFYGQFFPESDTTTSSLVFGVNRSHSGSQGNTNSMYGTLQPYPCVSTGRTTTVKMTVFVDHSVVEGYLDDGIAVTTARLYIPLPFNVSTGVEVFAQPSASDQQLRVHIDNVTVYSVDQIWISEEELLRKI